MVDSPSAGLSRKTKLIAALAILLLVAGSIGFLVWTNRATDVDRIRDAYSATKNAGTATVRVSLDTSNPALQTSGVGVVDFEGDAQRLAIASMTDSNGGSRTEFSEGVLLNDRTYVRRTGDTGSFGGWVESSQRDLTLATYSSFDPLQYPKLLLGVVGAEGSGDRTVNGINCSLFSVEINLADRRSNVSDEIKPVFEVNQSTEFREFEVCIDDQDRLVQMTGQVGDTTQLRNNVPVNERISVEYQGFGIPTDIRDPR